MNWLGSGRLASDVGLQSLLPLQSWLQARYGFRLAQIDVVWVSVFGLQFRLHYGYIMGCEGRVPRVRVRVRVRVKARVMANARG